MKEIEEVLVFDEKGLLENMDKVDGYWLKLVYFSLFSFTPFAEDIPLFRVIREALRKAGISLR
ncbi:MAG: hypothetical protein DRJ30_05620 [Candidatus Methanomethylicota archaeon]|nr:MAG: hypothetical protein DRJ30_05620 [Candidatus Verstraetearchaeota archaeon]